MTAQRHTRGRHADGLRKPIPSLGDFTSEVAVVVSCKRCKARSHPLDPQQADAWREQHQADHKQVDTIKPGTIMPCPKCGKDARVGLHNGAHCTHCFHSFRADRP